MIEKKIKRKLQYAYTYNIGIGIGTVKQTTIVNVYFKWELFNGNVGGRGRELTIAVG